MGNFKVELYIYDLSRGMASSLAPMLNLNFSVDGIWHTAIVVHGYEWFYGASGIEKCAPGTTMLGQPLRKEVLGSTALSYEAFSDYIFGLSRREFSGNRYDLFRHNCNNFSNVVANFLCSRSIPQHILDLPNRFLADPMGQMVRHLIEQMAPHDVGEPVEPGHQSSPAASNAPSFRHFPVGEYQGFGSDIDKEKLMGKLFELNGQNPTPATREDLESVVSAASEEVWWPKALSIMRSWKTTDVYPILDLLRWRIFSKAVSDSAAEELFKLSTGYVANDDLPEPVTRLSLRILANLFLHKNSREIMMRNRESFIGSLNDVVEAVLQLEEAKRQHTEIAASTVALNYAKALKEAKGDERQEGEFQLVSSLCSSFQKNVKAPEAVYRCLVALGTVASENSDVRELASDLGVVRHLKLLPKKKSAKLDEVIEECLSLFG